MSNEQHPWIAAEETAAFRFDANNEPVMTITPDGRFIVKGREVETNEEARDIFAAWCKNWNARVWEVQAENLRLRSIIGQLEYAISEGKAEEARSLFEQVNPSPAAHSTTKETNNG